MTGDKQTVDWYSSNAKDYAARTGELDFFPGLERDLESFARSLPPDGRVLDLGAGGGRDVEYFAKWGQLRVIAVDRSWNLLRLCMERNCDGDVAGVLADIGRLPLATATVDGVWASGSLLHLARGGIVNAIREIARISKRGSRLGLSMKEGAGEERRDGRLFTYVSSEELSDLIQTAGFSVDSITGPDRNAWLFASAERV